MHINNIKLALSGFIIFLFICYVVFSISKSIFLEKKKEKENNDWLNKQRYKINEFIKNYLNKYPTEKDKFELKRKIFEIQILKNSWKEACEKIERLQKDIIAEKYDIQENINKQEATKKYSDALKKQLEVKINELGISHSEFFELHRYFLRNTI